MTRSPKVGCDVFLHHSNLTSTLRLSKINVKQVCIFQQDIHSLVKKLRGQRLWLCCKKDYIKMCSFMRAQEWWYSTSIRDLRSFTTVRSIVVAITLCVIASVSMPASAQQQTTDSLSNTRNPQPTTNNLFNQNSDLQEPIDNQTLQQSTTIDLPAGVPKQPEPAPQAQASSLLRNVVLIIAAIAFGVEQPSPPVQPVRKTKQSDNKKKKRRAQSKKKR